MRHGQDMFGGGGPGGGFGPGDGTGPIHQVLGGGAGPWEWIFPILLIGLLAAMLVFLILSWRAQRAVPAMAGGPALPSAGADDPTRAAALRFARGEIDEDEFDAVRDRVGTDTVEGAVEDE